ncbi:MAG: hypothetical protein R2787_12340 [Saprospiraceae bacterium]
MSPWPISNPGQRLWIHARTCHQRFVQWLEDDPPALLQKGDVIAEGVDPN